MGLKIHQDGSKPTNSLEWMSVVEIKGHPNTKCASL